ncbi:uncharacterized protein LOC141831126 [Curcuma longa]|uniref:uncharacterized protein LOC141831126 n=1 Tax=Curcuma longa TaxID=136217 RepID=UPI003D9EAF6D
MAQKSLKDYAAPQMRGSTSCIAIPNIEAANFEFNPGFIAMIQQNQFGGGPHEDPHLHIEIFSDACSTRRQQGVSFDVQRLMLFRFSLRDKAKDWYHSLPPNCIDSWEKLVKIFMNKFYPPRGALMNKSLEEAEELIENVALNHHQWANERGNVQKIPGKYNVDQYTKLNAQIDALTKRVEGMNFGKVHAVATKIVIYVEIPIIPTEMCPAVACQNQIVQYEQCDAVGAFNQRNNPYSNTYNPGWRNHPNFSYRNNKVISTKEGLPTKVQQPPKASEEVSDTQRILKILEKLESDVVKINEKLDDHDKRMKMQETQIAQISSSLSSRTVGTLPRKTRLQPNGALQGHRAQERTDPEGYRTSDKLEEVETATPAGPSEQKSQVKNVPYPQRLLYKQKDEEFEKWYDRLICPSLPNFIKGLISTKDITRPKNVIALTEDVTEKILNNKIPQKLKDPGSFFLPCKIGNISIGRAFCDLGASVSIIPYTTSVKCGYPDLILTPMTLQLADQTCRYPKGLVEDVPVEVGGFTIPTDFVVLDMEEDPNIPIILGRSFLATSGANIDVKNRKLSLEVGGKKITFNLSLDSNAYLPEPPHVCRLEDNQPKKICTIILFCRRRCPHRPSK